MDKDNKGHDNGEQQEVTIIINSRPSKWSEGQISYEQLVAIAYPEVHPGETTGFTIDYKKGNDSGSLVSGQKVEVKNGMIFNVFKTNKS